MHCSNWWVFSLENNSRNCFVICCVRIGNQVMMKQWPWMKHFVRLWSMVYHLLLVGAWVLIDWPCYWQMHRISRFCFLLFLHACFSFVSSYHLFFLVSGGSSLPCHETSRLTLLPKPFLNHHHTQVSSASRHYV